MSWTNRLEAVVDSGLYSAVNDATLVYRTPSISESQLTWFDSTGNVLTTVGLGGAWGSLVLSGDGTRAIVTKRDPASNVSLWSIDMSRGVPTPLAKDPTTGYYRAAFSPDGRRMIFGVARAGELQDLYERPIDAAGDGERLLHSSKLKTASSWSPDGWPNEHLSEKGIWFESSRPRTAGEWLLGLDSNQQRICCCLLHPKGKKRATFRRRRSFRSEGPVSLPLLTQ